MSSLCDTAPFGGMTVWYWLLPEHVIVVFVVRQPREAEGSSSQIRTRAERQRKVQDFYQFTFNFAKNPGQKGLDLEMAVSYWNLVPKDRFKFLGLWNRFLLVMLWIPI
ncbi:hypothetical protein J4Q44_G00195050 [Coregonus suidteri]|uniref:DCN1-like protein n=1 Tax=Coregonus suidteri TaxID=861788 RepID=A0AAN8LHT2_9TELE